MRDRRAGQAEALARLPGDLDAFVEATAADVLAEYDRNDAADGVLAEFDALTKGHN